MAMAFRTDRINATEAKNRFGEVLEKAANNIAVSLIRHGKPAAYVVPPALYEVLVDHAGNEKAPLARLEREFDAMLAKMQTPESVEAAQDLMTINTEDLRRSVRQRSSRHGR